MPGMDMSSGGGSAVPVLAELALFWTATLVHVLRLLSPTRLPDTDRPTDAGHALMGAGMTLMVFPGVSTTTLHVAAVAYAAMAVLYIARATLRRSPAQHRGQHAAIGAGQAAMAYMLAAPTHPPAWVPLSVAAVLAGCAVVHGRRLVDARHGHGAVSVGSAGVGGMDSLASAPRMLVIVPHIGALVMTLVMAVMVGNV
ncbi:DUF5134 domain-containing protein [Catenulispora pinisilvae]|uniref:DUF5134 domain-containing protein n=1 Tax=Catenulispora pinisilvae TaxID=2705253 RepID=UPI001892302A|nr:DUF5134 domain-containing protein [Catenulispora pinisilvae]